MAALDSDLHERAFAAAASVCDPEIPVLGIADLGVLRDVRVVDGVAEAVITPTYSGCPAMNMIALEIELALEKAGFARHKVTTVLSPAWTTDWLSDAAKAKLKAYGIAAPDHTVVEQVLVPLMSSVRRAPCPYCGSSNTERKSEFGSTACKAIHYCHGCQQPFEEFKAI